MRATRRFVLRTAVCVLSTGLSLSAISCGGGGGKSGVFTKERATRQYNANLTKWRSAAPSNYIIEVSTQGAFSYRLIKTTVSAGEISSQTVTDRNGAAGVGDEDSRSWGTVDAIFDRAKSVIDVSVGDPTKKVKITYDEQYGFPKSIDIIVPASYGDGDSNTSVEKFAPSYITP